MNCGHGLTSASLPVCLTVEAALGVQFVGRANTVTQQHFIFMLTWSNKISCCIFYCSFPKSSALKVAIMWQSSRGQSGSVTPPVQDWLWTNRCHSFPLKVFVCGNEWPVSSLPCEPAGQDWHEQPERSTEQTQANTHVQYLHINQPKINDVRVSANADKKIAYLYEMELFWPRRNPTRKWLQCSVDLEGQCGAAPPYEQRAAVPYLGILLPAQTDEVFLEAQIQNITTSPMFMEKVSLEPSMMYNVTELNTVTSEGDG